MSVVRANSNSAATTTSSSADAAIAAESRVSTLAAVRPREPHERDPPTPTDPLALAPTLDRRGRAVALLVHDPYAC